MMPYVLRRAVYGVLLVAAVSILSFSLLRVAPGDFFDELRLNPRVSRQTVYKLQAQSTSGRSVVAQYGSWVNSIARGEWGYSLVYNAPATAILWPRVGNTMLLTVLGTVVAWALALVIGVGVFAWRGISMHPLFQMAMALLLSIPDVVLALLFLLFAVRSGHLPAGGLSSGAAVSGLAANAQDIAAHLMLPVLCVAVSLLPVLVAHVRSAVSEALQMPFVRAAQGYGIAPLRLLTRHVLPVAANPLLSLFGLSIGGLLSSSLLVEVVFGWPGLGKLFVDSILQRDLYIVADIALLSAISLLAGNFVADLLLYAFDPRIRMR